MRFFTAIELTDETRERIVAEQQRVVGGLRSSGARLRLVRPEHLHLTLVFIGEVPDDRSAAIVDVMSEAVMMAPFWLTFAGVGAFPPRGAPRVLFLAVTQGDREAVELHMRVVDRLEPLGVTREPRPFHPHLTLGRWRESTPAERPREEPTRTVGEIEVAAVTLFQSRLSSSGPTYTRLAAAPLVCP